MSSPTINRMFGRSAADSGATVIASKMPMQKTGFIETLLPANKTAMLKSTTRGASLDGRVPFNTAPFVFGLHRAAEDIVCDHVAAALDGLQSKTFRIGAVVAKDAIRDLAPRHLLEQQGRTVVVEQRATDDVHAITLLQHDGR